MVALPDAGRADAGGVVDAGGSTDSGAFADAGCSAPTCQAGVSCGPVSNACGASVECGDCTGTRLCGGAGVPNVCAACTAPTFEAGPLPAGALGKAYNLQLFDVVHGYAVQSYVIASGALPAGMHLGSLGNLYGAPIEPGHFAIEVEVVDSCPAPNTARGSFTLDIATPGARALGITNGFFFGAAATTSGTALTWGLNTFGELGRQDGGQTGTYPAPGAVLDLAGAPLTGIVGIAATERSAFAIGAGGQVWGWGRNEYGELGDGLSVDRNRAAPVLVDGGVALTNVVFVTSGYSHALALLGDGTAVGWGKNDNSQLSTLYGPPHRIATPIQLKTGAVMTGIVALAVTDTTSAALLNTGHVLNWGRVRGNTGSLAVPVTFANGTQISGIVAIAGGGSHFLALTSAGGVLAWGDNENGEFGNGEKLKFSLAATEVLASPGVPLTGATAIAAGNQDSYAVVDGGVLSWGANGRGQLGDPLAPSTGRLYPGPVHDRLGEPLTGVVSLSANWDTAFGLTDAGVVIGWGSNSTSQRARYMSEDVPWADYVLLSP